MSRAVEHPVAARAPNGHPKPSDPSAPYVRFASLNELHDLQFPSTDAPLELQFILITQVKELLFRMLYVEVDTARACIRDDDVTATCHALARGHRIQDVLLSSWGTLTSMSATDFVSFRDILGEASGIQSFMYRALEFIMGNKREAGLDLLRQYGPLHPILAGEVDVPSVYDEAVAYLHRNVRPIPDAVLGRDFSREHQASQDVEAAWLEIYRDPAGHPDGYRLAEALIELSFNFSNWRATHLLVVERMLGFKSGTGGTEGVEWLRQITDHRFFPELWSVRTAI